VPGRLERVVTMVRSGLQAAVSQLLLLPPPQPLPPPPTARDHLRPRPTGAAVSLHRAAAATAVTPRADGEGTVAVDHDGSPVHHPVLIDWESGEGTGIATMLLEAVVEGFACDPPALARYLRASLFAHQLAPADHATAPGAAGDSAAAAAARTVAGLVAQCAAFLLREVGAGATAYGGRSSPTTSTPVCPASRAAARA